MRPLIYIDAVDELWAVNNHDSTLSVFTTLGVSTSETFQTGWAPVALALWLGPDGQISTPANPEDCDDEILVVCRGSWGVLRYRRSDGALKGVIQVRPSTIMPPGVAPRMGAMAEPGDILVMGDKAFVSCGGADAVVQIDLTNPTAPIEWVFREDTTPGFRMKHPLFLSAGPNGEVFVTPLHSGNNSIWVGNGNVGNGLNTGSHVIDLNKAITENGLQVLEGLPDEDLFALQPASGGAAGTATVVATGLGTTLFAHAYNDKAQKEAFLAAEH